MKKILFIGLAFSLLSCKKESIVSISSPKDSIENKAHLVVEDPFLVDSVYVEEEVKLSPKITSSFSSHLLVFPSIKNKALLDSIYAGAGVKLTSYTKEDLKKELDKEKATFFKENKTNLDGFPVDFEQTWNQDFYMGISKSHPKVLTINYNVSGFSGGAHGYSNTSFKNFDIKNEKTITLQDIFKDPKKMNWHKILLSHFEDEEQKDMLLVDKILVNNNFYFNNNQITFVYNPYEITAYAAGVVFITIPFAELKPFLTTDFIRQYDIK